jgi:hypothetical protein
MPEASNRWPADLWKAPVGPIEYPSWSVPGVSAPVLSPRQWDAWARSQLARGVPIHTLLAQMVPPGEDPRPAYAFLHNHAASIRRQGLALAGVGCVITALGALCLVSLATDGFADPEAVKGAVVIFVLGATLLGYGVFRLARMTGG